MCEIIILSVMKHKITAANIKLISLIFIVFLFLTVESIAQIFPSFGDERAGVSLASSLKIGIGARSAALAGTYTAIADDASAVYWNPAGMPENKSSNALFSQCFWFGGITHRSASAVVRLGDGEHVLGFQASGLSIDPMRVTTEFRPYGTGEIFHYQSMQFSVAYAKKFTDQFSAGITIRYLNEKLGKASLSGVLFDAGTFYHTGLGTSRFAVAISNFGPKLMPDGIVPTAGASPIFNGGKTSSFQSFDPPITFRIGFAMEPILNETHRLTAAIQLDHPNDNAETTSLGAEYAYTFSSATPAQLFFRIGIKIGADEEKFGLGSGFFVPFDDAYGITSEYSYTSYSTLGGIHRLGVALKF